MKCDVMFANEKVKETFDKLDSGKYEEKQLKQFLIRALEDIKKCFLWYKNSKKTYS